jgi:hypothetical protein
MNEFPPGNILLIALIMANDNTLEVGSCDKQVSEKPKL